MIEHRYPPRELTVDYARAGVGAAATGAPMLFLPTSPVMMWALAAFCVLFVVFGARTALRHMTVVRVDDAGIAAVGPMGVSIRWDDLGRMALSYYSTRRDRTRGWMQLSIRGRGRSLRLDSSITGFRDIVTRAAHAAALRRLDMSPATVSNLSALGIATAAAETGPEPAEAGRA